MATSIDIRELSARFEEALALELAGREVILGDGSSLRMRLVPYDTTAARGLLGCTQLAESKR